MRWAWMRRDTMPFANSTMGPNRSLATCAAPGNAVSARAFAKRRMPPATQRAAYLTARPTRTAAYRAKAQCIEHCANAQYQLRRAQLPGGIVQPVSAAAIPPVAAQQMDALDLRPKRAQLCAEAGVPRRTGWLVLPRFSCFYLPAKRMLPSCIFRRF